MNKAKKGSIIAVGLSLLLILAVIFFIGSQFGGVAEERIILHASWAVYYDSIEEITEESDFIGLVEIMDVIRTETDNYGSDGYSGELYYTVYSAKVLDGIVSDSDTIEIIMTGKNDGETFIQIADDPLMSVGEKWFIFARFNDSGTHTILGGPSGRFSYDEKNETITSLEASDSSISKVYTNIDNFDLGEVALENIKEVSIADVKSVIEAYLGG